MNYIKIDPPGTFLTYNAVRDLTRELKIRSFLDVGCGAGGMSRQFLKQGISGVGLDFSDAAMEIARNELNEYITRGSFRLVSGDIQTSIKPITGEKVDLAYSMMVIEHIEDDKKFVEQLISNTKTSGFVMIAAPGRRDCWGVEDETVGHLRRYDREDLEALLRSAGLSDVRVISATVPVSNLLLTISNFLVRRSGEEAKKTLSKQEQTKTSGIREIPYKTVFPPFFRLFLNDITMYPLYVLQRFFYNTGKGLTMIGIGTVPVK